jgi:hypothetical protein
MYACCSYKWAIWGNLCKHQIVIILLSTNIFKSILLEFYGTYFGSQRGGWNPLDYVLWTLQDYCTPSLHLGDHENQPKKDASFQLLFRLWSISSCSNDLKSTFWSLINLRHIESSYGLSHTWKPQQGCLHTLTSNFCTFGADDS